MAEQTVTLVRLFDPAGGVLLAEATIDDATFVVSAFRVVNGTTRTCHGTWWRTSQGQPSRRVFTPGTETGQSLPGGQRKPIDEYVYELAMGPS